MNHLIQLYKKFSFLLFMIVISMTLTTQTVIASNMIKRVNVDNEGNEANHESFWVSMSSNGRFVAFQSYADNLIENDNNNHSDVFVHDLDTGTTECVSVDSEGNQGNNTSYYYSDSAMSAGGRFIAFTSEASNLVENDNNDRSDAFVHDRNTGITERVSVDSEGNEGNGHTGAALISADGRFVTFQSEATNLVESDTNGNLDIFIHDRQTGITERVSIGSNDEQSDGDSEYPAMSADGRFVAFQSLATNLTSIITGGANVFVRDRENNTTVLASINIDGTEDGDGKSLFPSISADGRFVAFQSNAKDLVDHDYMFENNTYPPISSILVRDLLENKTKLIYFSHIGGNLSDTNRNASISADGRFVAFISRDNNIVNEDTNGHQDLFVFDNLTNDITRLSVDSENNESNGPTFGKAAFSMNGEYLAFTSDASNLVPDDTNELQDTFVVFNPMSNVLFVDGFESSD